MSSDDGSTACGGDDDARQREAQRQPDGGVGAAATEPATTGAMMNTPIHAGGGGGGGGGGGYDDESDDVGATSGAAAAADTSGGGGDGDGGRGDKPAAAGQWACPRCTLHNPDATDACKVCALRRDGASNWATSQEAQRAAAAAGIDGFGGDGWGRGYFNPEAGRNRLTTASTLPLLQNEGNADLGRPFVRRLVARIKTFAHYPGMVSTSDVLDRHAEQSTPGDESCRVAEFEEAMHPGLAAAEEEEAAAEAEAEAAANAAAANAQGADPG